MKFYLNLIIYIAIVLISIFFPFAKTQATIILTTSTIVFLGVLIWASVNINSQFYIKTFCKGSSSDRIAITFDDGPNPLNTLQILNILDDYDAKATFFVIGEKAEDNSSLLKLMSDSGHLIGNHSYKHSCFFPLLSPWKIRHEILLTQSIIQNITKKSNSYFRPPFGVTNPLIASALKRMNMKAIGWSVRSLDTINKNPDKVINRIKKRLKGGDIILLHDNGSIIPTVLKEVLDYATQKGFKAVRVDALIEKNTE